MEQTRAVLTARKISETTLSIVGEQLPKCNNDDGIDKVEDECDKSIVTE